MYEYIFICMYIYIYGVCKAVYFVYLPTIRTYYTYIHLLYNTSEYKKYTALHTPIYYIYSNMYN